MQTEKDTERCEENEDENTLAKSILDDIIEETERDEPNPDKEEKAQPDLSLAV